MINASIQAKLNLQSSSPLINPEPPCLAALFERQVLAVERGDLQADIGKRPEAIRVLYHHRVFALACYRMALDEEAVALMLKIAIYLTLSQ